MGSDNELEAERAYLADVRAAHGAHVDRARASARRLGDEAADAAAEGIRDIIDEDSEADTAVRAAQVRQTAIRAMHAANRVRELEGQGTALAFGRFSTDDDRHVYVGRLSVFEGDHTLLVDWRASAAVPFYRATPLERYGVSTRRQFHFGDGGADAELVSFSDDLLNLEALDHASSLRGEAAVLASVTAPTTEHMKPVVALIQSEQDAIIRASADTPLIVQGGPGTGKTVVALHRAAYLLYDQRDELSDRGVLIVGPTPRFLRYISNVLPSLGETGVLSATPAELFPALRGHTEPPEVTKLKGSNAMVDLLNKAVRDRQRRPAQGLRLFYGARRVTLTTATCQAIFDRARRTSTHNDGAEQFRLGLVDALVDEVYDPSFFSVEEATNTFIVHDEVQRYLLRHWPTLTPEQCLNDLFGSDALLRLASRGADFTPAEIASLRRPRTRERDLRARRWSDGDIPLLDELESLLGQRATELTQSARSRERDVEDEFELAAALDETDTVMSEDGTVLRRKRVIGTLDLDDADVRSLSDPDHADTSAEDTGPDPGTLVDRFRGDRGAMVGDVDPFELVPDDVDDLGSEGVTVVELAAGERTFRFGHVIVDEAQDLSAMQWRMIIRRAEPGCVTAVGDLAQRTLGVADKWRDIMPDVGPINEMQLTTNYRSPEEVLRPASEVLKTYAPGLSMPRALRRSGIPTSLRSVRDGDVARAIVDLLKGHSSDEPRIVACIYPDAVADRVARACERAQPAAQELGFELVPMRAGDCRGLEFDASVIVGPEAFARDPAGRTLLFVALTRATHWSAALSLSAPSADLCRIFTHRSASG
ncbi:MAG: AAA family ATPase [Acidimicrobiales bacterium]|nr:AAA family ATPase [Acidimicrobiales bacterium]